MRNTFSQTFYIRPEVGRKGNPKPIYLQAHVNRNRVRVSANVLVYPENWDVENQRVIRGKGKRKLSADEAGRINLTLTRMKNKAEKIHLDYTSQEKYLSVEDFKNTLLHGVDQSDFIFFMEQQLEIDRKTLSPNTIKHKTRSVELFKKHRKTLNMNEIDDDLPNKFDGYIRGIKTIKKPGTIGKIHTNIKCYIGRAAKRYKFDNPYVGFTILKSNPKLAFLDQSEVDRLKGLYQSHTLPKREQNVLGRFLFSCHCAGVRVSDIHKVGQGNVLGDMFHFNPKKGERFDKAATSYYNRDWEEWVQYPNEDYFFDKISDQKANESLKLIALAACIEQNLTYHMSRHTFATGYLAAGGTVHVLQRIMAHSKIETTMRYVHLTNDAIREEGKRVQMFCL